MPMDGAKLAGMINPSYYHLQFVQVISFNSKYDKDTYVGRNQSNLVGVT